MRDPIPPSGDFRGFLDGLALNHPQLFYKPLFTCAATPKDHVVVDQLRILAALETHIPDILTRDADMTAIVLLSGGGGVLGKGKGKEDAPPRWVTARAGQSAIMFELIFKLDALTQNKGISSSNMSPTDTQFFHDLENKLAVLISAKEPASLLPFSQRILLSELLLRIRLYTKSWHSYVFASSLYGTFVPANQIAITGRYGFLW